MAARAAVAKPASLRRLLLLTGSSVALGLACALAGSGSQPALAACPSGGTGQLVADGCATTATGGTFNTGSAAFHAAFTAQNGGSITATGPVTLITGGHDATGAFVQSDGTIAFQAIGTSISTTGDASYGLHSFGPSSISGQAIVVTSGAGADGARAEEGGLITLSSSSLTTHGSQAAGATAKDDGAVELFTSTVATLGTSAPGLLALANGSTVLSNGSTISTAGSASPGLLAQSKGRIDAIGGAVSAAGAGASGLVVTDSGSTITVLRTKVSSAQEDGGQVSDSGTLLVTDSELTGRRHGLSAFGGTGASADIVTVSGGSLTATTGDAFHAEDTVARLTLRNGAAVAAGSGKLLNVISTSPGAFVSDVVFTVQNASAKGDIVSDASSHTVVNLLSGAAVTGIESHTFTTIAAGGAWSMTGNSDIFALTVTGGAAFAPPAGAASSPSSYRTLKTSAYVGLGGALGLNTFLASDGAPSDRLVIDGGRASGSTRLLINSTGGGGLTVGDGILVIDTVNGGTTRGGAFALGRPAAAGPYEYFLFRGNRDGTRPDSWYLRSNELPPSPPGPQPGPPQPIIQPVFRQEVSLYTAMPGMAAIFGRSIIGTLHERMGGDAQVLSPGSEGSPDGAWGRIIGYHGHREGDSRGIYGGEPENDFDFGALQAGLDLYRDRQPDGSRDNAGLYFAYGYGQAEVEHNLLGRTIDGGDDIFNAVSLGAYWTHFGKGDWYLDGVTQVTWYDLSMSGNRGLRDGETDGWGFAFSLEGGYPFHLGEGWLLEPQTQLVYQGFDIDSFDDGAADVRFEDLDSLAGRVGLRLARDWSVKRDHGKGAPQRFSAWGRADVWYEFLGEPTTAFSSQNGFVPFTADLSEPWVKIGLGGTLDLAADTTLYGNLNYQTTFDGDADGYEGKLGLKIQW